MTPRDRVEPAPATELADGDHVILQRARPLTLVEGSSERRIWTTAASVDEALRGVGVEAQPVQMSAAPNTEIPLDGLAVELRVPRQVSFVDGTAAPEPVTSMAGTVAALLAERGVTLGPDDVSVPSGDTPVERRTWTCRWCATASGEVVEVRRIPPPEEIVEDPAMPRGEREVVEKGRPGEQTVVMRVHVQNGEEVRREQVRAGGMTPPRKRVVQVGHERRHPAPGVRAVGRTGGVGRAGPLRGGRQLGDQHRQRLLRRPAVRPADLAGVRRRPVRVAARTRPAGTSRSRSRRGCATTAAATARGRRAPASWGCRDERIDATPLHTDAASGGRIGG